MVILFEVEFFCRLRFSFAITSFDYFDSDWGIVLDDIVFGLRWGSSVIGVGLR
jgi:hypothetical protein